MIEKLTLVFAGVLFGMVLISQADAQTNIDPQLDVSLGSMIGGIERPEGGQLPFWGEAYAQFTDPVINPVFGVGHESNADLNGSEFDGEYTLAGFVYTEGVIYTKVTARWFFRGNLDDNDPVYTGEAGFTRDRFRFTAFYGVSEGGAYEAQGLKFGVIF